MQIPMIDARGHNKLFETKDKEFRLTDGLLAICEMNGNWRDGFLTCIIKLSSDIKIIRWKVACYWCGGLKSLETPIFPVCNDSMVLWVKKGCL